MNIRYDEMRVDRLLLKEYQSKIENTLNSIAGLNDIEKKLNEFEEVFKRYIGVKYALAVNSGTDALLLSLLALGVGKGDSVIIPDLTYPAVALSVLYTGAKPILADIKYENLQIDEHILEKKIQSNTKAIIAVHMFSRPCNILKIKEIAKKHKCHIIEDCCQAESSEYQGKKLGSFADVSCFSFSYYKPLSSCGGGGGMVCFNDPRYEMITKYLKIWHDDSLLLDAGKKFPKMYLWDLIAIQVKFKYLKQIIKSRLIIKSVYESGLALVPGIRILNDTSAMLTVPQVFIILTKHRDRLGEFLKQQGVHWQKPYTPLHLMNNFKNESDSFQNSVRYFKEAIHLPLYSFMKKEECEFVTRTIKHFFKNKKFTQ